MRIRFCPWMATALILALLEAAAAAQEKVEGIYGSGPEVFTVAAGSPGELGLLKALGESFSQKRAAKPPCTGSRRAPGNPSDSLRPEKWT